MSTCKFNIFPCIFSLFLFFCLAGAVNKMLLNVIWWFHVVIFLTVPVLLDHIFDVRWLSIVSYYIFNSEPVVVHFVSFICFITRRRYAWVCAILPLIKFALKRRRRIGDAVAWYGFRIAAVVGRDRVPSEAYYSILIQYGPFMHT